MVATANRQPSLRLPAVPVYRVAVTRLEVRPGISSMVDTCGKQRTTGTAWRYSSRGELMKSPPPESRQRRARVGDMSELTWRRDRSAARATLVGRHPEAEDRQINGDGPNVSAGG